MWQVACSLLQVIPSTKKSPIILSSPQPTCFHCLQSALPVTVLKIIQGFTGFQIFFYFIFWNTCDFWQLAGLAEQLQPLLVGWPVTVYLPMPSVCPSTVPDKAQSSTGCTWRIPLHFSHFFHQKNSIFPIRECWSHLLYPWAQTEQKAMGSKAAGLGTSHTSFATSCKLLLCVPGTVPGAGGERNPHARDMATEVLVFLSPWCGMW